MRPFGSRTVFQVAAVVTAGIILLCSQVSFAETRVAEQTTNTASVNQQAFGANNYPTQSFVATTSGTVLSVATADTSCGISVNNGAFSYSAFNTSTQIAGGYRFTGGSFPVTANTTYFITSHCNNNVGNFGGTTVDSYPNGLAGHSRLPGQQNILFVSNASSGNTLLDWAFAVCTTNDCTLTPPPPTSFTPVIIIPGILGSAQHNGEWLIDPITHAYDNLIDTLVANGYSTSTTLFPFPYDWHKSNIDTTVLLNAKIDEVKTVCGCTQVDIVAHSMGGLVARRYIQSNFYDNDVRKLIFLGTPHMGAPKAYLMWEGGSEDTDFNGRVVKSFLTIESLKNGYSNLFDYVRAIPITSVQELLPVYGYIKHVDSPETPSFPNSEWYPNNLFLSDLNTNIAGLYDSGVAISNFVGQTADDKTITAIRVVPPPVISPVTLWGFGMPENFGDSSTDEGLERGIGDGTVPLSSASFVTSDLQIFGFEHNELPTKTEGQVFKKLTGNDAATLVNNSHGIFGIVKNVLIFQILSPADIVVVDPDGLRVGKDFLTGQEFQEIPDAFYSGYGTDDEYVTIPNPKDGEYKVITQGTGGGGEYTLATSIIGDATSSDTFFTGLTLPGLITEHDVNIDPTNPSKTTITPADQTPPTITFAQPATSTYTHADLLPVEVEFADDTGVASSSVVFETAQVAASSTIDLFFQTLGNHTITAYAEDLVNNATTSGRIVQVIATVASTQSDINRAFALGWIKSKDTKNILTSMLTAASKLKKQSDRIRAYRLMLEALKFGKNIGVITPQGYQLLVADINWLINH